jgi:hypothetical protein
VTEDELYRAIDRNRQLARFGDERRWKPREDPPVQLSLDFRKPQRAANSVRRETERAHAA